MFTERCVAGDCYYGFCGAGAEETKQQLILAIQSLPMRDQRLLSLYYYEDLTFKEVGEVLELSESRVCQLHAKAMTSLKAIIS